MKRLSARVVMTVVVSLSLVMLFSGFALAKGKGNGGQPPSGSSAGGVPNLQAQITALQEQVSVLQSQVANPTGTRDVLYQEQWNVVPPTSSGDTPTWGPSAVIPYTSTTAGEKALITVHANCLVTTASTRVCMYPGINATLAAPDGFTGSECMESAPDETYYRADLTSTGVHTFAEAGESASFSVVMEKDGPTEPAVACITRIMVEVVTTIP